MAQLTGSRIFNALKGLLGALDSTDEAMLKRVLNTRFKVRVPIADAGSSANSVTDQFVWNNDTGGTVRLVGVNLYAQRDINPGATHNVAFTVESVSAANGASATIATWTSNVAGGTASAQVAKAFTLGSTPTVANGSSVIVTAAKGGSGVLIGDTCTPSSLELTFDTDA